MMRKVLLLSVLVGLGVFCWLSGLAQSSPDSLSLQTQLNELTQTNRELKGLSLTLAGALTILGGLILYFFKKSIDAKVKAMEIAMEKNLNGLESAADDRIKEMERKIVDGINEKADTVYFVLDKTSEEQALLRSKRVFVWGEQNLTTLRKVLRIAGFNLANLITDPQEAAEKGYDVLLINNEQGQCSPVIKADKPEAEQKEEPKPKVKRDYTSILTIIGEQLHRPEVCIFYYNTNQVYLPINRLDVDLQHRVNFATNASQIYGNLLNTLKYQERLKRGLAQ